MTYYEHHIYKKEIRNIIEESIAIPKLQGKTIAVTGARGLIGSMLVDTLMYANHLKGLDCQVYGIVRDIEKAEKRFARFETDSHLKLIKADINTDEIQISQNIDYFIHGASNTHPVYYSTRPIETIRTNTIGTDRTLDFACKHQCQRYLFLSSVEIYGENRGDVDKFSEDYCGYIDCNTLRAGYPESKRVGESLCQAYRKERGLDCVIARIARCYGPGLLQEDSKALTQFLRNAVAGDDIVLKSEGKQLFSYVYVADAVDAIFFILTEGLDGSAYNVVGKDDGITLGELADLIAHKTIGNVVYDLPNKSELDGYSKATKAVLNGRDLKNHGWEAKYSIEDGLEDTLIISRENQ